MRRLKSIMAAALVAALVGTQGLSETLDPPSVIDEEPRGSVASFLGPTEILITVLAVLLLWAAYDQNERATSR